MTEKNKFESGTIIKFQGLVKCAEMNNSYGIVKSEITETGRLRVQVNAKNDQAIESKHCAPVIQCPNKLQRNVPCLIWPKLKGDSFPRIHWLHEAPKDIFPENSYKQLQQCGGSSGIAAMVSWHPQLAHMGQPKPLWNFSLQPGLLVGEKNAEKTVEYLKNVLNWKNPVIKGFSKLQQIFVIWYDRDSTAKINELVNTIIQSGKDQYHNPNTKEQGDIIRGPVVYFDHEKMLDKTYGSTAINKMMAIMIAGSEIIKNPEIVKTREWEHNPMMGLSLEGDGTYMRKRMFEMFEVMAEERICGKVKGKQKCRECKEFKKMANSPLYKKSMADCNKMMMDDPANFYKKCPVKTKAADRVFDNQ